jgi:LPXTG-site transpeptidase (sortase) family protein
MPRRARSRAACFLAVTVTVAAAVAAVPGAGPASAAARPGVAPAREIQHVRQLTRAAPGAGRVQPAPRPAPGPSPTAATRPRSVDIPAIGERVPLVTLGGAAAGTPGPADLNLPTPPLTKAAVEAGWYQFTATPGAAGNAVIVGHVDTYAGPGVFYNLYQLSPGDAVYVTVGRARQRFLVTSVREMSKASFPVSQVFGGTARHMLWLITCGGAFDYETGHYLDNIVVSAAWDEKVKPKSKNSPGAR